MMSAMAALVAVGGTSLVCYLLMNRVQNRKPRRESAGGDTSGIGSGDSSGGDCWNLLSWFGSDSSSSDSSTSSSDSSGDSGGGATAAVAAIDAENPPVNQCQCDLAQ